MSNKFEKLATKIGAVVDSKNKQYGDSFAQSGEFLKLIYPDGIPPNAYTDALCIVRIFDKLKRLGNASNLPVNEGKIDAWSDIIGYGLLGLQKDSEPVESGLGHAEMLARRIAAAKEQHEKNVRLVEAGKAVADDIKKRAARACFDEGGEVVKHGGFVLDKNVLGDVLTQPIVPVVETAEETITRLNQKDGRYLALGAQDDDGKIVSEKIRDKFKTELGQKELREELMKDEAGNISYWKEQRLKQIELDEAKPLTMAEIEERQKQINLLAAGHAVAAELVRQKEVQANILKEIEKAKLKHDAALPFVNEEHSTERHYDAAEVARKAVYQQLKKDSVQFVEDLRTPDFVKGQYTGDPVIRCAICQKEFDAIPYGAVIDGSPVVHEACYRERFAKSPE